MVRASIFSGSKAPGVEEKRVDLSTFTPKGEADITAEEVKVANDAASATKFTSREPTIEKPDSRYRSGRGRQMNIRMKEDTERLIKALAYHRDCPIGKVVEDAIKLYAEKEGVKITP